MSMSDRGSSSGAIRGKSEPFLADKGGGEEIIVRTGVSGRKPAAPDHDIGLDPLSPMEALKQDHSGSGAPATRRTAGATLRADGSPSGAIIVPGRNCALIAYARRTSVLIDAAEYFTRLDEAFQRAVRSILIVGWDFDARIRLRPDRDESPELGTLLRRLVETKSQLEVRILIWDLAGIYGPGATMPLVFDAAWHEHSRIQFRLDSNHPIYAAQHQKIVCIDGQIAFVGGIDLTVMRWDTVKHSPTDPCRTLPDGKPYVAVHDVQVAVDGEAAEAICKIACDRWEAATGEELPAPTCRSDPWPPGLTPDFSDTFVGIARTAPAGAGKKAVREIETLNIDALHSARKTIYIETQYLADSRIVDVLVSHLKNSRGPEIVVVVTRATHGMIEKWIMGNNRDRMIRKLRRADRFDRFRAYYPTVVRDGNECEILVHSKLIVVDDKFIRIGSSNMNRRSMGLDTECDLAIEATDTATSKRIAEIRNRLIAEHLGATESTLGDALARERSLTRAIDSINGGSRRFAEFHHVRTNGPTRLMPGTRLLDPRKPFPIMSRFRDLFHRSARARRPASKISPRANRLPPTARGRRK